jgi:hypothetical protein
MERRTALQRRTPIKRFTKLAAVGSSDTTQLKNEIQAEVRRIVIARDGGCVLRGSFDVPACGGYATDGHLILQADHLITRANSATFADPRLIVCVCKSHHGWKSVGGNARKAQYDAAVRAILPPDRIELWDRCEKESWKPHRVSSTDWAKELAYLRTL